MTLKQKLFVDGSQSGTGYVHATLDLDAPPGDLEIRASLDDGAVIKTWVVTIEPAA